MDYLILLVHYCTYTRFYNAIEPISARQVREGWIYKHTVNQIYSNRLLFAVLSYKLLMDCNTFDFKLSTFYKLLSRLPTWVIICRPDDLTGVTQSSRLCHSVDCRPVGLLPRWLVTLHNGFDNSPEIRRIATLCLDLLHPKSIGFDRLSTTTAVPSFKTFYSGVFILIMLTYTGWQFGVAVTRWSRSTQLLYIEPG